MSRRSQVSVESTHARIQPPPSLGSQKQAGRGETAFVPGSHPPNERPLAMVLAGQAEGHAAAQDMLRVDFGAAVGQPLAFPKSQLLDCEMGTMREWAWSRSAVRRAQ